MRHVFSPLAIPPLSLRVQQPGLPALLVFPSGLALPCSPPATGALSSAVPPPRQVAQRAQRDRTTASGVLANDDV